VLGLFGPLSLILLMVTWIFGLVAGFGLLQMSSNKAKTSLLHSLYVSGATFFTLGSEGAQFSSAGLKILQVAEAGCGLGFLALVIAYLPVLYQLLARREVHVMLLDERAGSPPTAVTLLQRDGMMGAVARHPDAVLPVAVKRLEIRRAEGVPEVAMQLGRPSERGSSQHPELVDACAPPAGAAEHLRRWRRQAIPPISWRSRGPGE